MKRVRIAQGMLVFGIAAGLLIGLPGFVRHVSPHVNGGHILVNGRIEGTEVSVGTKLPGRIRVVQVAEGQHVKTGQPIAELESDDVQASYDQAEANVARSKHALRSAEEEVIRSQEQLAKAKIALELTTKRTQLQIKQAEAAVEEAKAIVAQAKARLSMAKTAYDHAMKLREKDAVSDREFSDAEDNWVAHQAASAGAEQRLAQARKALELAEVRRSEIQMRRHDLAVMESTVRSAKAAVGIAQAQVTGSEALARMIKIKLRETKIFAPCNGVLVTRVVEPGEVVAAGATVGVVVDFDQLYLKGYLPTALIGQVKLNDPVRVFVDGFPDRHFDAKVTKINQQAEFTPKTVDTPEQRIRRVFGLELTVDNADRRLKPGMPADGVIKVDSKAPWQTPGDLR